MGRTTIALMMPWMFLWMIVPRPRQADARKCAVKARSASSYLMKIGKRGTLCALTANAWLG